MILASEKNQTPRPLLARHESGAGRKSSFEPAIRSPRLKGRVCLFADVDGGSYGNERHYRQEPLAHETGCVVFIGKLSEPECCMEIATDVARIASPTAFCFGVSEAHPEISRMLQSNVSVRISSSVASNYTPNPGDAS